MWSRGAFRPDFSSSRIYLLIPDDARLSDPYVALWTNAASEEGFEIEPITDSQLLRPDFRQGRFRRLAIIVPDTIHLRGSAALTDRLNIYAREGGTLMLVYDALTEDLTGAYPSPNRFKTAVGVDYARYRTTPGHDIFAREAVSVQPGAIGPLGLPPGSYTHPRWELTAGQWASTDHRLTSYSIREQLYPHFRTQGSFHGRILMKSPGGEVLAGVHSYGEGQVLFVNLPLGYLKMRTDGLMLHSFLHYLSVRMLGLPTLLSTPNGIGGLVMNLHLDSNAALAALPSLKRMGIFRQRPYSVHITAGPDARAPGDGLGFDVDHNPQARRWIRYFLQRGDVIGSHGGWIHDYFGLNVNDSNRASFQKYLELNRRSLQAASGGPIVEYSAPVGTHPRWVTDWLEGAGMLAYYFTGNVGLGPTQSFRDGEEVDHQAWSFPVMTYGQVASLEEARKADLPGRYVLGWLNALTRFSVENREVRLVYFHPPGILFYPDAMTGWLKKTRLFAESTGQFRWYTMSSLARFLNRRKLTSWGEELSADGRWSCFWAKSPDTLRGQTWRLPKAGYSRPVALRGRVTIGEDAENWLVTSLGKTNLEFRSDRIRRQRG